MGQAHDRRGGRGARAAHACGRRFGCPRPGSRSSGRRPPPRRQCIHCERGHDADDRPRRPEHEGQRARPRRQPSPSRGAALASTYSAPGTGEFTWTPTAAQAGEHVLTFTAETRPAARPRAAPLVRRLRALRELRLRATPSRSAGRAACPAGRMWPTPCPRGPRPRASARVVGRLPAITPELVPRTDAAAQRKDRRSGSLLGTRSTTDVAERLHGLGAAQRSGSFKSIRTRPVIDRSLFTATLYRSERRDLPQPDRGRAGSLANAEGRIPRSGEALRVHGPDLRTARIRAERPVGRLDRLAQRRLHRNSRDKPAGILPGRVSHGCIRLPNAAILRLARLMPMGTPVTIT